MDWMLSTGTVHGPECPPSVWTGCHWRAPGTCYSVSSRTNQVLIRKKFIVIGHQSLDGKQIAHVEVTKRELFFCTNKFKIKILSLQIAKIISGLKKKQNPNFNVKARWFNTMTFF